MTDNINFVRDKKTSLTSVSTIDLQNEAHQKKSNIELLRHR
jgi:hypothetical protein